MSIITALSSDSDFMSCCLIHAKHVVILHTKTVDQATFFSLLEEKVWHFCMFFQLHQLCNFFLLHIIWKWCFVYNLHVVSIYSHDAASKHCQFWYVLHYYLTTVVEGIVQWLFKCHLCSKGSLFIDFWFEQPLSL